MKTKLLSSLISGVILSHLCNHSFSQGTWTKKADCVGTSRYAATGFSIGNYGYIGTGVDGAIIKDFWQWNKSNNTWTQEAPFGGVARYGAVGFSIGAKGYIGTGMDASGARKKDFWEYNPASNSWIQKTDFGGTARESAIGFSIAGKGYIGTGQETGTVYKKDFWEYDPADISNGVDANGNPMGKWTQRTDFGGTVRSLSVGFSIGNKGYIGTGMDAAGSAKNDLWQWDGDIASPAYNTWVVKTPFAGAARFGAIGFSVGDKAYIGVGRDGALVYQQDFWQWDTVSNVWTQTVNFGGTARNVAVGFSIGNKGYIGTGYDGAYQQDFWEWNPLPVASASGTNLICFGQCNGSATVTATGGTPPYTYMWNNLQITQTATGLCSGTYTVTVTDADNDIATATVTLSQPTALSPTVTSTATSCFGSSDGTSTVVAAGGTPPYTYLWSNLQTTSQVSNLASQAYSVTITDTNGCAKTQTVTVTQPTVLSPTVTTTNVSCFGGSDGTATAAVTGGTPPYTYLWSNLQTTSQVSNLTSQTYSVTITDANLCTTSQTVAIIQPTPLIITTAPSATVCAGSCITLLATATGGNGGYTYLWQPGNLTTTAVTLCPSTLTVYTVTATDIATCMDTTFATITVNSLPIVLLTLNPDTVCINSAPYALTGGSPSGGIYSGTGVSGGNFDPAAATSGTHIITYSYSDINGCTDTATAQLFVDVCTGINQLSMTNYQVSIFPNPFSGIATLRITNLGELRMEDLKINIYNVNGKEVHLSIIRNSDSFVIRSGSEANGIYFYQITAPLSKGEGNGEAIATGKLIIQ